jgi:hypothetical protein
MERTEKRRIEAAALIPLMEELERFLPVKSISELLTNANKREAYTRGKNLSINNSSETIDTLFCDVSTWGNEGEIEINFIEKTKTSLSFDVRKCPYQELYKELGIERYGTALSCCRDESFARGLDVKLKLRRSRTLMEGGDRCDFRYTLEDPDEE